MLSASLLRRRRRDRAGRAPGDREDGAGDADAGEDDVRPPDAAAGPRALEGDELRAFLRGRSWAVLSTCGDDGMPYAVPVAFGWDGEAFFVASGPGRKLRHLEAGGGVCLTVPDVEDGSAWRCVVARGRAEPVTGMAARAGALRHIARQQRVTPSPADAVRAARSSIFRIHPAELTGRARG